MPLRRLLRPTEPGLLHTAGELASALAEVAAEKAIVSDVRIDGREKPVDRS